jgi:isochorismate synthase
MGNQDKIALDILQSALTGANLPFVSFRLPGHENPVTLFGPERFEIYQRIEEVLGKQTGFVMAPYEAGAPLLWLKAGKIAEGFDIDAKWPDGITSVDCHLSDPVVREIGKPEYVLQVQEAIAHIKSGEAGKIVISRQLIKEWPGASQNAGHLFRNLCRQFPDAFVYLANIPDVGLWTGASPEVLLKSDDGTVSTMSLSGTRKTQTLFSPWGQKEIDEHLWVSRYIAEGLEAAGCELLDVSPMHTMEAGSVEHLITNYSARCPRLQLPELIAALHPTPAVCGWPTAVAARLIDNIEQYDRSFYTGYLGPVWSAGSFHLFVNLRCMQIINNKAVVYVGGGITTDSDPETEWEETVMKSRTMLGAIENLANFTD